jgi:hypothetical protein
VTITESDPASQVGHPEAPSAPPAHPYQAGARDCFGSQPDLSLRLAIVPFSDKVLLVWLRTELSADRQDAAAKLASFE